MEKKLEDNMKTNTLHKEKFFKYCFSSSKPCHLVLHYCFHQFSSVAQSCPTLGDSMHCCMQASLSITNSWSLLKLMSIESLMSSNHLISAPPAFRRHLHGISMYLNGKKNQQQKNNWKIM